MCLSTDETLDLGFGLTIAAYTQLINTTSATLEAHNTLVSEMAESRKTMDQADAALADMSERMLRGVALRYGKDSIEYVKAGGSNRKRGSRRSTPSISTSTAAMPMAATMPPTVGLPANGTPNGNGTQPVLN